MSAFDVEHINPRSHTAMRMTAEYVQDLFGLIQLAKEAGKWSGSPTPVTCEDGTVGWQLIILFPDDRTPLTAHPGYWIIADNELNVEVLPPTEAALRFRGNVDFDWDATEAAPAVSVVDGGNVVVQFRQPKSLNGPWSYVVTRTDLTDDSEVELEPTGQVVTPVVDGTFRVLGADVVLTVPGGLDSGKNYRFKVAATAAAHGTRAESPYSDAVSLR